MCTPANAKIKKLLFIQLNNASQEISAGPYWQIRVRLLHKKSGVPSAMETLSFFKNLSVVQGWQLTTTKMKNKEHKVGLNKTNKAH